MFVKECGEHAHLNFQEAVGSHTYYTITSTSMLLAVKVSSDQF